jgi:hypothetical protein
MAKSKNEKSKIKVEKIGGNKPPEVNPNPQENPQGDTGVENVSQEESPLKVLQVEAVSLGMPQEDALKFTDEETLKVTINALKASKADKVVTLEEKANPREDREIEKKWRNKAERQKVYFESLPKVRILIPCEGAERPGVVEERVINGLRQMVAISGAVWSKTFNGYRVVIPKGVYTEVSEAVADNIAKEFSQVQESNNRFSVDRLDPETGRPVRDQL